jgi:hypothetical protein
MPDVDLTLVFAVILLTPPILVGIAWLVWFRSQHSAFPEWRAVFLRIGLFASTANVVMFYAWLVYRLMAGSSPRVWMMKDLASVVAGPLGLAALLGVAFGKGTARILLALSALTGFLLWIRLAVL